MPTYDYQCQSCQHVFSALHKISDSAPPCPECGGEVKKLLSAPAIKGSSQKSTPAPMPHSCGHGGCGHHH